MSVQTVNTSLYIDPEIKTQAEKILESLNLPVSAVMDSLYRQIIQKGELPFPLIHPEASEQKNEKYDRLAKRKENGQHLQSQVFLDEDFERRNKKEILLRAFSIWNSSVISLEEAGTVEGLVKIHEYLFRGYYRFAGKIREQDISKGRFQFTSARYLKQILEAVEEMPENTYEQIMDKYIEMNIAHPFLDGNGRSTRIWLDLMLKKNLQLCIDWSQVDKNELLEAMQKSIINDKPVKQLLQKTLTGRIDDEQLFKKGIGYSCYFEEV